MFQICEILGHPRDEHGEIKAIDEDDDYDPKDAYRAEWRARGLSEEEIEHKYAEDIDILCYRQELVRKQAPDIERKVTEYRQRVVSRRTWGR